MRTTKPKPPFEHCLFEACERSDWLLHAFTLMDNHYHLASETLVGNLVAGMQWLQATFARIRDPRHVNFQPGVQMSVDIIGRGFYKAS